MSATVGLPDLPARKRALLDHGTTLLVEAGAGSGKTAL
jgi:ATP-dependent exoDNAse (exonuclease V) beta subunit